MYPSSNAKTSQAYSIRTRLGFQILLAMKRNNIGPAGLPRHAQIMIDTWVSMKAGRPSIPKDQQLSGKISGPQMQLLRRLPSPNAQEPCSADDKRLMEEFGDELIERGLVEIFPVGLTPDWSYRLSISGEAVLEMVDG